MVQSVVNSFQVMEVVAPAVDPSLRPQLLSLLPSLLSTLCSRYTTVRHMAARVVATMAQVDLHRTMQVSSVVVQKYNVPGIYVRRIILMGIVLICDRI